MRKRSVHDMLTLLGDAEQMGHYKDRLSRVIGDTLRMADSWGEIDDIDLLDVAAARKDEEMPDEGILGLDKKN